MARKPRETPPNTPTDDEIAVLKALTAIDATMRQTVPHLGANAGDGLAAWLKAIIGRELGIKL